MTKFHNWLGSMLQFAIVFAMSVVFLGGLERRSIGSWNADASQADGQIVVGGDGGNDQNQKDSKRSATLIRVDLPLDAHRESALLSKLERLANKSVGSERPLVVLEFSRRIQEGNSVRLGEGGNSESTVLGRGTSFEKALAVARWLTSAQGNRLHTVAYLPESVAGHAVLIALACEEIALSPQAEFGKAGIDESAPDPTVRQAYIDTVEKRGNVFPKAAIVSMLDPNDPVYRVDLVGGATKYVSKSEIKEGERDQAEWKEEQLVPNGHLGWFSGEDLRSWKWISYLASDLEQLSTLLRLSQPIQEKVGIEGPRVAVRVGIHGKVTARSVDRMIRATEEGLKDPAVNLLLVEVDSNGGDLAQSLRLAQYLADLSSELLEVVCFVPDMARGDAALIALAGDSLFVHPDSILGGAGEATITPELCFEHRAAFELLARDTGRTTGELLGLTCPDVQVFEYTTFDGRRTLASPDFLNASLPKEELEQWTQGPQIAFASTETLDQLNRFGVAFEKLDSWGAIAARYNLDALPHEIRTNRVEQIIDWLSSQVWLSFFLFFVGLVALSAEMGAPGLGFPGLLAGICFGLFFWLRMLDGTVEWLEILLIVGGIVCILMEIVVVPGTGIFGIGGLLMLGLGLLLAAQTFVWPTNDYQRVEMVKSLGQITMVVFSLAVAAFVFRRQLMALPMVKWLSIEAPVESDVTMEITKAQEELHALIGWSGHTMTRCNPLGKATVAGRIVNVVSEDGWIDEDTEIVVADTDGQKLIVRKKI